MKLTKETLKRIINEELEQATVNEIGGASMPGRSIEDGLRDFLSDLKRSIRISTQLCDMKRKAAMKMDDEQLKADVIAACDMIESLQALGQRYE